MEQPSIVMPDAMLETIDTQPGNSRSEWVRGAVDRRFFIEELEADADDELPADWWQDALEEYLSDREQPASIEA
jgi:hypothetical protein